MNHWPLVCRYLQGSSSRILTTRFLPHYLNRRATSKQLLPHAEVKQCLTQSSSALSSHSLGRWSHLILTCHGTGVPAASTSLSGSLLRWSNLSSLKSTECANLRASPIFTHGLTLRRMRAPSISTPMAPRVPPRLSRRSSTQL